MNCLIKNGADVDAEGENGCTPLHMAIQCGHIRVVDCLIQTGRADKEALKAPGLTPLHFAIQQHKIKIVNFLLESGVNVNARGRGGNTPLHFAVDNKLVGILEDLILR